MPASRRARHCSRAWPDIETTIPTEDVTWGRAPGARPPLGPRTVIAFTATLAVALSVLVVGLVRPPGPLDQHDPADQRNGLLLDGPEVPAEVAGIRFGGRPVVLLFLRAAPAPEVIVRWRREVSADVELVLPSAKAGSVDFNADPRGELAQAVALPVPNDGGPGVGYAVVDGRRSTRYSTLDPRWYDNAFEVRTIVGAVA